MISFIITTTAVTITTTTATTTTTTASDAAADAAVAVTFAIVVVFESMDQSAFRWIVELAADFLTLQLHMVQKKKKIDMSIQI